MARQGYRKVVFQRLFDVVLADVICANHCPNHPLQPSPYYGENGLPKPVFGRCSMAWFRNFLHFSQLRTFSARPAGCEPLSPNREMAIQPRKQGLQRMAYPATHCAASAFDIVGPTHLPGPGNSSNWGNLDKTKRITTKLGRPIKPSVSIYVGPRRPIHRQLPHDTQQ